MRTTLLTAAVAASSIVIAPPAAAQLSFGGVPFGLMENGPALPPAPVAVMHPVDHDAMIAEDEARLASGIKAPYRFGFNHAVDLSLENSGVWHELPSGDRLWRLAIHCPGAYSINFEFHDYVVPERGLVFVYNDAGQHRGAFMAASNPGHTSLGVAQLPGDRITIEYFEPQEATGQGRLRVGRVTHAYRDLFKQDRGFGDSGACNINVVCPEGDGWENEINSVAIITVGGNGLCTGQLLNNCAEDGTPYFLTADHCLDPDVANWVFCFNWQSPACSPSQNVPMDQTVSGCQLLANSAGTDVALLLLNTTPPPDFNPFWSGWYKGPDPAQEVTCIHHPRGDLKKISHQYDPVIPGTMSGADCWHVQAWDAGTTEPGSSGSGLWNQDHLLVGQLFGGVANCDNNVDDYYGRFDISFPLLEPWLGTCGDALPGLGGSGGPTDPEFDAAVTSIVNVPALVCGTNIIGPRVTLKNNGNQVLTSLILLYGVAGQPMNMGVWNGSLLPGQTYNHDLPPFAVPAGNNVLQVSCSSPNGQADQVPANDLWTHDFTVNFPSEIVTLTLNADNWGSDITWTLVNEWGTLLYQGGPYPNINGGQQYQVPFCLTNGCYTFTINDLFGDGICCASGNGNYTIANATGTVYGFSNGQYGAQNTNFFCLQGVGVAPSAEQAAFTLFPNPTPGVFTLSLPATLGAAALQVTDATGRTVLSARIAGGASLHTVDLGGQAEGVYAVAVEHRSGRSVQRVLLRR